MKRSLDHFLMRIRSRRAIADASDGTIFAIHLQRISRRTPPAIHTHRVNAEQMAAQAKFFDVIKVTTRAV